MASRARVHFTVAIQGTDAADTLPGGDFGDIINAASGDDVVNGGGGDDTINGDKGRDTLNGDDGNDTIHGGTEDDVVSGGNGDDKLFGDDGNDLIKGDAGSDAIDGGTGFDTVDYSASRAYGTLRDYLSGATPDGVQVNLQTGTGGLGAAGDTYVSIENVIGSSYRDKITGSDDDNVLSSGGGNDTVVGGAGNDTIDAGTGNDGIDGGDGKDTITGGQGSDKMLGGADADTFVFQADLPGNASTDNIMDFAVGTDQLVFRGFEDGHIMLQAVDGGTLVWAEDSDERSDAIMLWDVDASTLKANAETAFIFEDTFADRARIELDVLR